MSDATLHVVIGAAMTLLSAILIAIFRTLIQMRDALLVMAPKVEAMDKKVDKHETWLVQMRARLRFDGSDPVTSDSQS